MITQMQRERVLARLDAALGRLPGADEAAAYAMAVLKQELPHCAWVGVYWLAGGELRLGPFQGPPTEHVRIPVGRGVCGTAVAEGRNQVVPDVRERENYLACSAQARAEIVVLVRDGSGRIRGQIDADGDEPGAFDGGDEALLEEVAARLAPLLPGGRKSGERRGYRTAMNERILGEGHKGLTRFFALDADAYREGALPVRTKELLGLVGSLVLRCNDCVFYHLDRCVAEGIPRAEIVEALHIGLVVGGSIVIPHLRYAFEMLDDLAGS